MYDVAVVIPSYKKKLDENEIISVTQCRRVLYSYDIIWLLPEGLIADYVDDDKVVYVNGGFLSSRNSYSKFVISKDFYRNFHNYEYILIYQLDSFVFRDDLLYYCRQGYDYIGAKWLYGMECYCNDNLLWYYGNGGFSLRKVNSFLKWIENHANIIADVSNILSEDLIIAIYGKEELKIADDKVSRSFSFDVNPKDCFLMNNKNLPFGCHAWNKFNIHFWKSLIDKLGYNVVIKDDVLKYDEYFWNNAKKRNILAHKYFNIKKVLKCLNNLFDSFYNKVSIFGAGQYGFCLMNILRKNNIEICSFYDNDKSKIGGLISNIKIYRFSSETKNNVPIIIAVARPNRIIKQLNDFGLKRGSDYITSYDMQIEMIKTAGGFVDEYYSLMKIQEE